MSGSTLCFILTFARIIITCFFINSAQILLYITIGWWNPALNTRYETVLQRIFVESMEKIVGSSDIVVTGDPVDPHETAILIANHQMDVDWWYIWCLAKKFDRHGNFKIALKKELFYVPIIGWGIYFFDFLFLSRKWEKDERVLQEKIKAWSADGDPFWYLIFPEGTTIHQTNLKKTQEYAKAQGRPNLNLLLLPRTRGLLSSAEFLSSRATAVYDLTMCYPSYSGEVSTLEDEYTRKIDKDIPSFKTVTSGKIPKQIYFHVKRYEMKEVLESKDNFESWLDRVWVEKESLMRHFITHKQFPPTN